MCAHCAGELHCEEERGPVLTWSLQTNSAIFQRSPNFQMSRESESIGTEWFVL